MTDEEIIEIFCNASNSFTTKSNAWPDDTKALFCNLARKIHDTGMDWWVTGPRVNYLVRFGFKNPNSKGKVVGELKLRKNTIKIRIQKWPEIEIDDKDELLLKEQLINDYFTTPNWPQERLGEKTGSEGRWPSPINNYINDSIEENNMPINLNSILYGPPGTGKTYTVIDFAHAITSALNSDNELNTTPEERSTRKVDFDNKLTSQQIRFVTFHQSFSYEEFVEGIRAVTTQDGHISYVVKPGIFKSICTAAEKDPDNNYVLIIDEINRGNISKIFGELITLIEPSKRKGAVDQLTVTLPYTQESFSVPKNLYLIGTMNTADRSLALMDTALRRRFNFIEMPPQPKLLDGIKIETINIKDMYETLNQRIEVLYDREHTLGHAFFISLNADSEIEELAEIFQCKILPLLQEYFFEDWEKIRIVLGDDQKSDVNQQFIIEDKINSKIFSSTTAQQYNLEDSKVYKINTSAFYDVNAYLKIYS